MIDIQPYLQHLQLPDPQSHKGQNGKLLIIGGSNLFHAASKWSLDIASKFVDMVFYASVPSNNELIQQAKGQFWNGIVIPRTEVETYIQEADCILIGPGMDRQSKSAEEEALLAEMIKNEFSNDPDFAKPAPLPTYALPSEKDWSTNTEKITNYLLAKYLHKKWVIDAGALQMIDVRLLNERCVITPHQGEWEKVKSRIKDQTAQEAVAKSMVVIKGPVDTILYRGQEIKIEGGNAGMTKGGTGDVLAGLIAGLYTNHDILTAAVVGSYMNKKAGEELWQKVGPNFNASDLVSQIPLTLWQEWRGAERST